MRVGLRRCVLLVSLFAAVVLALAMPVMALATPGDGPNDQIALPAPSWSEPVTGTLLPLTLESHSYFGIWYTVPLIKGQTVVFTSTSVATGRFVMIAAPYSFLAPAALVSDYPGPGIGVLTVMAPRTALYDLTPVGSSTETYSIEATVVPPVRFSLSSFAVPAKVKKNKAFGVSVRVYPDYDGFFPPITFEVQRKSHVFKKYKKFGSNFMGTESDPYTVFVQKLKLPAGTYQVRATFSDASGTIVAPTKWKHFVVK
jgi:hypothetical protein